MSYMNPVKYLTVYIYIYIYIYIYTCIYYKLIIIAIGIMPLLCNIISLSLCTRANQETLRH